MKTFLILLSILVLSYSISAQAAANSTAIATSSDKKDDPKKDSKKSGIEIPVEKRNPINIPKIGVPVIIDGKPDEELWKTAAVFKDFYQTYPGNNTAPSKPTEVYVMYDEFHLYIAFKCWDEKDKIRASTAKRDDIFGEDNVRVWLDTYNDQRRAYVFGFNPYGVQADGIFTEGRGADFSVDLVFESKGVIEDWGWSVEAKIPFKSLRFFSGKGKQWGFNVARNIDRFNDEFDQWLPEDRNISGFLIQHGKITGIDEIKYERTLELIPSVTLSETGNRVASFDIATGRMVNHPMKSEIGLNLKYTLTPNITLDAAFNPDFAEIEADAPVVMANQRFPIFFQEKRPFFLEGSEIFQTPMSIYDSRSIVDPDYAAKLTGKIGKNSFGIMLASDKAPGNYSLDERNDPLFRPRIDEFLDKNAFVSVVRVKRDIGAENHIGFFSTFRKFPEQDNMMNSIDGRIKINPKTVATFQVVGTYARRCFFQYEFEPEVNPLQAQRNRDICGTGSQSLDPQRNGTYNQFRTGNAFGYFANMDYSTDTHGWYAEVGGRTRDYRADVGFTRRRDTNFAFFVNRFSTKSNPKGKVIRANFNQFTGIDYDWSGRLQGWRAGVNTGLNLQRSMFFFMEGITAFEKIYEEEFGLKRQPSRPDTGQFFGDPTRQSWKQGLYSELSQTFNKYLSYGAWVNLTRNAFDYFSVFHLNPSFDPKNPKDLPQSSWFQQDPGPGKSFSGGAWMELKPTNDLRFSSDYQKARLNRNDTNKRAFDSDVLSIKSTYQFSRFVYIRARLDYQSDGFENGYAGQILFGWNPSPGKALYIGYNDNFSYNGINPFTGNFQPGFARDSRTFFIRASYLFRKSFK